MRPAGKEPAPVVDYIPRLSWGIVSSRRRFRVQSRSSPLVLSRLGASPLPWQYSSIAALGAKSRGRIRAALLCARGRMAAKPSVPVPLSNAHQHCFRLVICLMSRGNEVSPRSLSASAPERHSGTCRAAVSMDSFLILRISRHIAMGQMAG